MQAFDLLAGDEAILGLAVSGGSDSTALLALAADWARVRGKRIEAATVDHGLRPEAAAEAAGVAALCAAMDVPHAVLHWQRQKRGPAAQAEARRARHALLAVWAGERDIRGLALGHTRDDRIETFLIRTRQGSGWRGLAGPLPSGPSPVWPEGRGLRLIRPLLAFGREELRAELEQRRLSWIEDPSNASDRFERVRMRELTGRMGSDALRQALRVMDGLVQIRAAVTAEARAGLSRVNFDESAAYIEVGDFTAMGAEARLRLLEAAVMAAGGADSLPRSESLKRLASRIGQGGLSGGVTLAGAWIRRDKDRLAVLPAPARRGAAKAAVPAWDRAEALLADPRSGGLAV
jgi:tRNA(Ile)-lysidine synthase